jgi:branched-subunit amino acid aminotransferase/4-amino-4-deoxychorismate lyase
MNQAKAQGCQEIVMHRNGYMTEAGASNVFYFDQSGTIRTSALTENILPGITRDILIKALNDTSHQVTEGSCSIEDFDHSPCIWLSSSTKGILPLTNLIGTEYRFQEDHAGYKEVLRVFNAAMQSHLSVLE